LTIAVLLPFLDFSNHLCREVQNIVNDTSIPRPIRNKLFNDMQSDIGLEINPQQIFELAIYIALFFFSTFILNYCFCSKYATGRYTTNHRGSEKNSTYFGTGGKGQLALQLIFYLKQ
jgi:hypothetical protein